MPKFHIREDGLHCPGCGYLLKNLQTPRCPECGIDYRAALRQPLPTVWTHLRDAWLAHTWLRCVVIVPACLFTGLVSLGAFFTFLGLLNIPYRGGALMVLWGLGTLLIAYLLAFRWTAPRAPAREKATTTSPSSRARQSD